MRYDTSTSFIQKQLNNRKEQQKCPIYVIYKRRKTF